MYALSAPDSLEAPLFTSTGDVRALVDQLNSATDVLNLDITKSWYPAAAHTQADNDFVNGWIAWRDQTYAWIKEFRGYWTYLAWNQYDVAVAKLNELLKWRESFEKISGRSATGPAPTPPPGSAPINLETWVKTGLVVLGVGIAAFVGVKLYAIHKAKGAILGGARYRRFARR